MEEVNLFHEATNLNIYVFDQHKKLVNKATTALAPTLNSSYLKHLAPSPIGEITLLTNKNAEILGYFMYKNHYLIGWSTNYNLQGNGIYESKAPLLGLRQFQAQIKILFQLFYSSEPQLVQDYLEINEDVITPVADKDQDKQNDILYQGYLAEQNMLTSVTNGDLSGYTNSYRQFMRDGIFGTLASQEFRSKKNLTIASTTLFTRAAIKGGLSVVEAYTLSDQIILKTENEQVITNVYEYTRAIGEIFLRRVQRVKRKNLPTIIYQAQEYILSNLNRINKVDDVAQYLDISASYLMHLFKETTGQSLMAYVTRIKIDEAKRQLIFSNASLADIAYNLGFNSQSQFSRSFKDQVGQTPLTYRKQMRIN